ncbi:MAG: hypothetical protein AB8B89_01365 [Gammaproteobacteria bacterium]
MGTYLKNNSESTIHIIEVINDNWDLDTQLKSLENWLIENSDYNFIAGEWIAEVGFEPRYNTSVAGYTVSSELMRRLAKNNISLWLSDYRGV